MSSTSKPAPVHAPMDAFPTVYGELIVGGLPLSRLAERIGQTLFYAYPTAACSDAASPN